MRTMVQPELGDGARPGGALQAMLREEDFILRIQDAMEDLGVDGIICLLEGSFWLD